MKEVSESTDLPSSFQHMRTSTTPVDAPPKSFFRARSDSFASSKNTETAQRPSGYQVAQVIVENALFRAVVNTVIVASAIQMGLSTDVTDAGWKVVWASCEHMFTACFLLESVLLMLAYHLEHFKDSWNLFDFFIMVISVMDTWLLPLLNASSIVGFRQFRLLRLLRIAKLTKVSPELTVVVEGLLNSMKSMIWIFALLFVILYAAAICCVQTVGSTDSGFASYDDRQDIIDEQLVDNFNNFIYFGSISRSMVTLFGIVLLSEWSLIRPIAEVHTAMIPFFVIVVVLVTFGVLNVIIGIVVEKTTSAVQKFQQDRVHASRKEQASIAKQLCELAFELDTDGDARISIDELRASFENEHLRELFCKLDLPLGFEAIEFLYMLDVDGNGSLSKQEFVQGILRLIFCSEFQRDCLHNMTIGALHNSMNRTARDLREELRRGIAEISQEIREMRYLDPRPRNMCIGDVDQMKSQGDDTQKTNDSQKSIMTSDCIHMVTAILHKQSLGFAKEDTSTTASVSTSLPITPPTPIISAALPTTPRRTRTNALDSHAHSEFVEGAHVHARTGTKTNMCAKCDQSSSLPGPDGKFQSKQRVDSGSRFRTQAHYGDTSSLFSEAPYNRENDDSESDRRNWRV